MGETGFKAIRCGRFINGTGDKPTNDVVIIVEGHAIRAVGKDLKIPSTAMVIDASDKTVMPGLIESHLHLIGRKTESYMERVIRPRELTLLQALSDAKAMLAAGFTTVKDCGGIDGINAVMLKRAAAEGTIHGIPRIVAASYSLSQTFGHGDVHFFPPECADVRTSRHPGQLGQGLTCDGVPECIKATRYALRSGADFIKITTTGGVSSERDLPAECQFNLDEITAIVETAAQVGKYVTSHSQNSRGTKNAVLGGVKTIEHANETNDEVIALAKERGVIFVSTLAVCRIIMDQGTAMGMSPWSIEKACTQWELHRDSYNRMRKAGALLAAGTDFSGSEAMPLGKNAVELELLVNNTDYTPLEAITAATKNGALACFMGDKTGTLEAGKMADIIVVDGNPLEDIALLQNISKIKMVMLEGKIEINRGI